MHCPFEHEERLRELFIQQQEVNRSLDLDKGETQVVAETGEENVADSEHLATRRAAREHVQTRGSAAM